MKKFTWLSYGALATGLFSAILFSSIMAGWYWIHPTTSISLILGSMMISIFLGVLALFKRTEKKWVVVIALIISIGNGLIFGFSAMMSLMV